MTLPVPPDINLKNPKELKKFGKKMKSLNQDKECKCKNPLPDGRNRIAKHEGSYQYCDNCFGRLWN